LCTNVSAVLSQLSPDIGHDCETTLSYWETSKPITLWRDEMRVVGVYAVNMKQMVVVCGNWLY